MDKHTISDHGYILCDKCDYIGADKELLIQHKMKHSGTNIFICGICEFEATRQAILENHMENKHTKKTFWWHESEKSDYYCDKCEKKFKNIFVMRYHMCLQETKYACPLCEFMAVTYYELYKHLEQTHTKKKIKCEKCDYESTSKDEIDSHIQLEHEITRVDISSEEQLFLNCDQCEYKCGLNIKLKKHKQKCHDQQQDTKLRYQCEGCVFSSDYLLQIWEHRLKKHPDFVTEFSPNRSNDMALSLIAEQNVAVGEEMEKFKIDMKHSFNEFAQSMRECFQVLGKDYKEASIRNQTALGQLSDKMETKFKEIETKIEKNCEIPDKLCEENVKTKHKTTVSDKEHNNIKDTEIETKKTRKIKSSKKNVKWIGTSLSNVLEKDKLEKNLDVNLSVVKAYTIEKESSSYFKEKNFSEVVPIEVENKDIDILVLQSGSIEITDLDINEAVLDTTKDLSDYKREWFKKVEDTSEKLFDIAENALRKNRNIEKVIIVKRLPRFDRGSDDILQMKSKLSEFGNTCYDQLWRKRGSPENIKIVNIDLQVSSSKYLKYLIFGDPSLKNYDGIHMRGEGGARHFTYRTIQAVREIIHPGSNKGCLKNKPERKLKEPNYLKNDTSHTTCPQAVYQKWKKIEREVNSASNLKPSQSRTYAEVVDNRYAVPTKNRFNPLN